jgi:hypothetical protein
VVRTMFSDVNQEHDHIVSGMMCFAKPPLFSQVRSGQVFCNLDEAIRYNSLRSVPPLKFPGGMLPYTSSPPKIVY